MLYLNQAFSFLILIFASILFFQIYFSNKYGPLVLSGWIGLFAFSTPIFLNVSRKVYYFPGEEYSLVEPSIESKFIYFLFWIGFLLSLYLSKRKKISSSKTYSLDLFIKVCTFYLFIFWIYMFSSNNLEPVSIIGKWLSIFLIVGLVINKNYLISFLLLILIICFGFITADRTLSIISSTFFLCAYISHKNENKTSEKKLQNLIIFIFGLLYIAITIVFTKLFANYIAQNRLLSISLIDLQVVLYDLYKSFEPLIIYGHVLYALDEFLNFNPIHYFYSIISNFVFYPSIYDLSSNYYNLALSQNFPDLSFGIAGSIFASTFLFSSYFGLLIIGLCFGKLLVYADFRIKFYKNSLTVFIVVIASIVSVYIYRNALDNFLSIVRQVFILYAFIFFNCVFIEIIRNKLKKFIL